MKSNLKPLQDQVIVVTGASSGIGLATARMAAERGAKVVLAARSGAVMAEVVREIEQAGGHAAYAVADVGRRDEVKAIAETAITAFGRIDTWVNVAGQTIYGRLRDVSDTDSERLLQTNLWGTIYGSLVALDYLEAEGGALVNVGSVASDLAFPMQGMYVASKHAVKGFTDALRIELMQDQIPVSVTLIKPTSIDTPLPQRARNYMDREPTLPPPIYKPEEVANAILHAAVHGGRDIYVGGSGKILSDLNAMSPSATDMLGPMVTMLQQRREAPRDPEGALHHPTRGGQVRGDAPGYVMRTSAYTRASLHPVAASAAVAVGLGSLAAILMSGFSRGRRRS